MRVAIPVLALGLFATVAVAEAPRDFLRDFERGARSQSASFAGFSAQRGEHFFNTAHGREWSCSSCHTRSPSSGGRHAKTDKPIAPLAPAANAERFTRSDKVEKWFRRNCKDVLGRECTPLEKGDVLTYLLSIRN
jgi:hypothetical protein